MLIQEGKKKRTLQVFDLLIFISLHCNAQSHQKYNLNFETQSANKKLPKGWFTWGHHKINYWKVPLLWLTINVPGTLFNDLRKIDRLNDQLICI